MIDQLRRLVAPLANRVANLVVRAVVKSVDAAKNLQELQLSVLDGEVRDEVEHFEHYGLTSNPKPGAEVVAVCVGGRRDHTLAIGVADRRYRIKNLESGEVALYNDTGAKIVFKANGDIEVTPKAGQKLKISADVDVTGTLTASVNVVGGGKSLATHTHSVAGGNGAGPVVFAPPALTGSPT